MVRFVENIPDDKLIGGMGKGTICEDVNFRLDLQRVREAPTYPTKELVYVDEDA
jgi:hypothetical protein